MSTQPSFHHSAPAGNVIYAIGTPLEAWGGFDVVRFASTEGISQLYEYDITLLRQSRAGRIDLADLVGQQASFRIALTDRWRTIHGIIAEAQELECTRSILLYRVLLTPAFWFAKQRKRCRTFVDKSLREIVTFVLENRGPDGSVGSNGLVRLPKSPERQAPVPSFDEFLPHQAYYFFHLQDESRIDDRALRHYVVQYNETDYDFVSRLLEEEGLSMVFSQIEQGTVLTITDRPLYEPFFPLESELKLRTSRTERSAPDSVWSLVESRRLRAKEIYVRDWDEERPLSPLEGHAVEADPAHPNDLAQRVFPGRDEAVAGSPGTRPAAVLLNRQSVEQDLCSGSSACRSLEPGFSFGLSDDSQIRDQSTWVVVAIKALGRQLDPDTAALHELPFGFHGALQEKESYQNRFDVLPEERIFVPARNARSPRIEGVHTAVVTADEVAGDKPEIHCNERGAVRLRFPWDERKEEGAPSSAWVRVSQTWAGAGFGGMVIPRVGHEVLVAYMQGDPERPVVVGRVYNAIEPEPYALPESKTKSTWKSRSTPKSEGFNELRFEDAAGAEEIYVHAQKNLNEVVLASHSESVGGDQSYSIGGNQTFSIGQNQVNTIQGRRSVFVTEQHYTGQAYYKSHADHDHEFDSVNAAFTLSDMFGVSSKRSRIYGTQHVVVSGDNYVHVESNSDILLVAGKATINMSSGCICIDNGTGASITLLGSAITIEADGDLRESGGSVYVKGGFIGLDGGEAIDAKAVAIKLNS